MLQKSFILQHILSRIKNKYIAISASNFTNNHNQKTYSLLDYENDLKFASLNEKLLKIRDKYGVDIIKYGNEIG